MANYPNVHIMLTNPTAVVKLISMESWVALPCLPCMARVARGWVDRKIKRQKNGAQVLTLGAVIRGIETGSLAGMPTERVLEKPAYTRQRVVLRCVTAIGF
jgi:hypothetical protein